MSQENAYRFILAAQQDPALMARIQVLDPTTAAERIPTFARELGFDFTDDDFQQVIGRADDLDDAALEQIAGGSSRDWINPFTLLMQLPPRPPA